jgi:hypothetical protein
VKWWPSVDDFERGRLVKKASALYTYVQINGAEIKGKKPFAGSVMDYIPVNICLQPRLARGLEPVETASEQGHRALLPAKSASPLAGDLGLRRLVAAFHSEACRALAPGDKSPHPKKSGDKSPHSKAAFAASAQTLSLLHAAHARRVDCRS